jgi:hypothetical protein
VLSHGARLAIAGLAVGMVGSFLIPRMLAHVVDAQSPAGWVWMAAPAALAVLVVVASVLPARRSLIVNPLLALRQD